jgi:hypothetical protein
MKRFSPRSASRIASEKRARQLPAARTSSTVSILLSATPRPRRDDQIVDHRADLRAGQLADQPLGATPGNFASTARQPSAIIGTSINWSRLSRPARRPSSMS